MNTCISNKQSRTVDRVWSSSLGIGRGAKQSLPSKLNYVTKHLCNKLSFSAPRTCNFNNYGITFYRFVLPYYVNNYWAYFKIFFSCSNDYVAAAILYSNLKSAERVGDPFLHFTNLCFGLLGKYMKK